MKQQKGNYFKSKFDLLNSQENPQEIIWSCSDSSEYENSHNEIYVKAFKRKRKRVKSKKQIGKNISNLDIITYVDVTLEKNNEKSVEQSRDHSNIECVSNSSNVNSSPILTSQRYLGPFKTNHSTAISASHKDYKENEPASPVLVLKYSSPKFSPKVRKKLFNNNGNSYRESRSLSPVLSCTESKLKKTTRNQIKTYNDGSYTHSKEKLERIEYECDKHSNVSQIGIYENFKNVKNDVIPLKHQKQQSRNDNVNLDDTLSDNTTSVVLVEKVKSYFDSYFSSTTNSQHSISEYESKSSSKSNNEIEIINSQAESKNTQHLKSDNRSSSDSFKYFDNIPQTTKKVKYKKDGLAYRLSALIKKQNASASLWHHERFLAANSNFVLPKEEFIALRLQEVSFKYGCYLLKALNVNDENCIVIINHLYSKSNTIEANCILKLYKPYKIIEFEKYKLIINVCKYECFILSN